jgi:hypothetical protein
VFFPHPIVDGLLAAAKPAHYPTNPESSSSTGMKTFTMPPRSMDFASAASTASSISAATCSADKVSSTDDAYIKADNTTPHHCDRRVHAPMSGGNMTQALREMASSRRRWARFSISTSEAVAMAVRSRTGIRLLTVCAKYS